MRVDLEDNNIPTDVSNSTDSEDVNSAKFECTAECSSMHEGRQLVQTLLPINVDSLMAMLFTKSKFFAEFHESRKTTNMVYRDWIDNEDGTKTRTINFTVVVAKGIGPKTSNITEVQIMRKCSVPQQLYSIDVTLTNAGIPYADSFQTVTHYCLMRTVDDHTMFGVYSKIEFTKSVWGIIKSIIEKSAWSGMDVFFRDLLNSLQSEYCIPPAKSRSRRSKKVSSQKSAIEHVPIKRSSLRSTTKTVSVTLPSPQASFRASKRSSTSTQSSDDSISSPNNSERSFIIDMFSAFLVILIVTLVMLNIYLSVQFFVLKYEQTDDIQIDRTILEKLNAARTPAAMKENWLNLLNEQMVVHEAELVKWQGFVQSAVDSLQNVRNVYSKLSIDLEKVDEGIKDEF